MNNTDKEFVNAIDNFRTGNKLPEWINSEDEPFPTDRSFLVAWVADDEIDLIEWYKVDSLEDMTFWNLNSSNLNDFKPDGSPKMKPPTHWMDIKLTVKK